MSDRRPKLVMAWSSGKDSAMALHALRQAGEYEIVGLMTSVSQEFARISHHGVRVDLLEAQADAIGLPLRQVLLPTHPGGGACTNDVYERIMGDAMRTYLAEGVTHVAFGDLFLEDLRAYRERNLAQVGMQGVFPLWMRDTRQLARDVIAEGFKAILTCVEPVLGQRFAGAEFDDAFLTNLPCQVDPCGERGEFHTFVYDGPIFRRRLNVSRGQIVCRDGRHYADLLRSDASIGTSCHSEQIPPV